MIIYSVILFIVSCVVLIKAGSESVKYLAKIAKFLKWTEFTTAFLLMAFISSLPELFVGIMSAFHKSPEISLGNVFGSNIINLTLALSIAILITGGIKAKSAMSQRTSIFTIVIGITPVVLMADGILNRIDGIILLLLLSFYVWNIAQKKDIFCEDTKKGTKKDLSLSSGFWKVLFLFLFFILLLLISAEGIVWSSKDIALFFNLPILLISILLVALGTNLPEIIFSVKAASLDHKDMILGNLMGSVIVNSTLVLGVTILITPITIFSFSPYIAGMIFVVITAFFFAIFIRTEKSINRKEAIALLFIYLLFVITQIIIY